MHNIDVDVIEDLDWQTMGFCSSVFSGCFMTFYRDEFEGFPFVLPKRFFPFGTTDIEHSHIIYSYLETLIEQLKYQAFEDEAFSSDDYPKVCYSEASDMYDVSLAEVFSKAIVMRPETISFEVDTVLKSIYPNFIGVQDCIQFKRVAPNFFNLLTMR
jgi:hypothetical protein